MNLKMMIDYFKKQILSQFNVLKQKVDEEVKQFNLKNKEARDLSKGYFDNLR